MSEPINITDQAVQTITLKRYQCRHIFTDGRRCGSPCLKREEFCYYHHTTRRAAARTRSTHAGQTGAEPAEAEHAEFDLPLTEDRSAIQISIGEVLRRIARNQIDPRRAGLLLYGLQIASLNIARAAEPARDKELIEEITAHPELGTLAPTAEMTDPAEKRSFATTLIEKFNRKQAEQRQAAAASAAAADKAAANQSAQSVPPIAASPIADPAAETAILPRVQACRYRRAQQKRCHLHPARATSKDPSTIRAPNYHRLFLQRRLPDFHRPKRPSFPPVVLSCWHDDAFGCGRSPGAGFADRKGNYNS